jgi:hypothetical protein
VTCSSSKSELFTHACRINALRKEAQLPLRDIREMIAAEQNRIEWQEHARAVERYRAVCEGLRERVRQEYVAAGKGDFSLSVGGQRVLAHRALEMLDRVVQSAGHRRPALRGVQYGE